MAGGFEGGVFSVALLATEGIVDFGVADQAIGHLRHCGRCDLIGFPQAAVAGFAGVLGVQVAAYIAGRLEVRLFIDGSSDGLRHVAHFEMLGVAEEGDAGLGRRRDLGILVALEADGFRRQQVVRCLGAGGGRGVAGYAL
jgi:hypothetical protein